MGAVSLDAGLIDSLFSRANAAHWGITREQFAIALNRRADSGVDWDTKYLADLALACACEAGFEPAWDYFVREFRPVLYRAADALDPFGGAREMADALYADLFGTKTSAGERQSLFRYFHGRSSLATWLRAVLSQRVVDRARERRRNESLDDNESGRQREIPDPRSLAPNVDPDRERQLSVVRQVLIAAIAALAPRDRLRLSLYYVEDVTLAAIGRVLREHEGSVSRHLTRIRGELRRDVEARLSRDHGMDARTVAECLRSAVDSAGSLNLDDLWPARKNRGRDRSI